MQLALHATRPTYHGVSRLVQTVSAWSVKTGRAPPRHCRDARVYGHTTTAMYDNECTPPPPSLSLFCFYTASSLIVARILSPCSSPWSAAVSSQADSLPTIFTPTVRCANLTSQTSPSLPCSCRRARSCTATYVFVPPRTTACTTTF